jgi:hypothetical protein
MRCEGFQIAFGAALVALAASAPVRAEEEGPSFSFHPSIEATNVFDDNPRFGDASADTGFWIYPRTELGYRTQTIELGADLGVDVRRYIHTDSLADELYRLSGFAELGLLPGLTVKLSDEFVPQPRQLGRPEDSGANLAQTNRLEGEIRYWRELPGARELELGARGTSFTSESFTASFPGAGGPLIDPSYHADFWQASSFAEFRAPAGKRSFAHLLGQFGYRDFDDSLRSDHVDVAILAGYRSERFRNLEIEVEAGYGLIAFDSLPDRHQPIGKAMLRHRLPSGFAWHVLAANRFRSNLVGNEVFETTGELGMEQQLGEHTSGSIAAFVSRFKDRGTPSDLYGGAEFELGRNLARKARVSAGYRYWWNRGDAGADDFTQNVAFLRFSYRH